MGKESSGLVPALVFAAPGSVFRKHHSCPSGTRTHSFCLEGLPQRNRRWQSIWERREVMWNGQILSCPLPSWGKRGEAEWDVAQLLIRAFSFPGSPKSCVPTGPLPVAPCQSLFSAFFHHISNSCVLQPACPQPFLLYFPPSRPLSLFSLLLSAPCFSPPAALHGYVLCAQPANNTPPQLMHVRNSLLLTVHRTQLNMTLFLVAVEAANTMKRMTAFASSAVTV